VESVLPGCSSSFVADVAPIHHTASQLYQFLQEDTVRPSFVMGTFESNDFLPLADVTRHGTERHRCQSAQLTLLSLLQTDLFRALFWNIDT
jgi:hypothetical protein